MILCDSYDLNIHYNENVSQLHRKSHCDRREGNGNAKGGAAGHSIYQ